MEPIYWAPVNDVAAVVRATWFYKETMMPVEVDVANLLEAGYVTLRPWTQTWRDELDSAVSVGAEGEMKVLHRLWPDRVAARPSTATSLQAADGPDAAEKQPEDDVNQARAMIEHFTFSGYAADGAAGQSDIPDHRASGTTAYGRDGQQRRYHTAGIIYADSTEACILRPNLQPSAYYGRRPLANYIRRGRKLGVCVVRGFSQTAWDQLHRAPASTATHSATADADHMQPVTDLVLVIHGIGQKLSRRMESYHFTYAMNAFRRSMNFELRSDRARPYLRRDMGGIEVLPVSTDSFHFFVLRAPTTEQARCRSDVVLIHTFLCFR